MATRPDVCLHHSTFHVSQSQAVEWLFYLYAAAAFVLHDYAAVIGVRAMFLA